jgi:hypothetical protein
LIAQRAFLRLAGQIFVPASGAADEGEHENVAAHGALDGDRLIESNAA